MLKINGIKLSCKKPQYVRKLLEANGLRGPWVRELSRGVFIKILENEYITQIQILSAAEEHKYANIVQKLNKIDSNISTAVIHKRLGLPKTMLFPLRINQQYRLESHSGIKSQPVLVAREGGVIANATHYGDVKTLTFGFRLSDFATELYDNFNFHGLGHLSMILEWFLDRFAKAYWVRISPWPKGRPPLLMSFDVEINTPNRSVGKTLCKIWNLELNKLKIPKPLRGKRVIFKKNTLNNNQVQENSYRLTTDFRRSKLGYACVGQEVTQLQLHIWKHRYRKPTPSDDKVFRSFASGICTHTNFYCGGLPAEEISGEEMGFHSTRHKHFNLMNEKELTNELHNITPKPLNNTIKSIRAPGLCWNKLYFSLLKESRYKVDSSFREINDIQPIFPIKTNDGWWEFPVQGNIFYRLPYLPTKGSDLMADRMISVYSHDHDVCSDENKALLKVRVEKIISLGWTPMTITELYVWLEQSQLNEIKSIEWDGHKANIKAEVHPDTLIETRVPEENN